ncbi:acyl-CoA thioester hydrolase, YbgC/YbaW family domain protein [Acinetobacter baumannii 1294217]|nr:acyl-CoA thioester hydrolase, YbgC/YbaW family domain protein [Acinetobacter baumannii 1159076]EXB00426.1 acyl-CoA thioester hydrolase, YbgC/YbaW family domain protein [Acinetobacter baumannii 1294217]
MDAFGHVNNVQYYRYIESSRILYMEKALLHKDLKVKTSHIYSNLSDNSGMWSA